MVITANGANAIILKIIEQNVATNQSKELPFITEPNQKCIYQHRIYLQFQLILIDTKLGSNPRFQCRFSCCCFDLYPFEVAIGISYNKYIIAHIYLRNCNIPAPA